MRVKLPVVLIATIGILLAYLGKAESADSDEFCENKSKADIVTLLDTLPALGPLPRQYAIDDLLILAGECPHEFAAQIVEQDIGYDVLLAGIETIRLCGDPLGLVMAHVGNLNYLDSTLRTLEFGRPARTKLELLIGSFEAEPSQKKCDTIYSEYGTDEGLAYLLWRLESSDGARTWDYAPRLLSLFASHPEVCLAGLTTRLDRAYLIGELMGYVRTDITTFREEEWIETRRETIVRFLEDFQGTSLEMLARDSLLESMTKGE